MSDELARLAVDSADKVLERAVADEELLAGVVLAVTRGRTVLLRLNRGQG